MAKRTDCDPGICERGFLRRTLKDVMDERDKYDGQLSEIQELCATVLDANIRNINPVMMVTNVCAIAKKESGETP